MQYNEMQFDMIQKINYELDLLKKHNLGQNPSKFYGVEFHLDEIRTMLNVISNEEEPESEGYEYFDHELEEKGE